MARNIKNLAQALQADTLSAMAWMVADGILDFKLALPMNKLTGGDFHDKFGIFTDAAGNQLSFNGSYNESIQGTRNYESIKLFRGWEPAFAPFVQADVQRFERLWHNQDPNVQVYDLPASAREQIVQLRQGERPYPEPEWVELRRLREASASYTAPHPYLPEKVSLRDYQEQAIHAWFEHACQGLFEMATGTGKTITALGAATRLFEQEQRLAVIITVPYQHLVDQWQAEAASFGFRPILAYQSKASWLDDLNHEILDYNGGYRNFISVITTHTTFVGHDFYVGVATAT